MAEASDSDPGLPVHLLKLEKASDTRLFKPSEPPSCISVRQNLDGFCGRLAQRPPGTDLARLPGMSEGSKYECMTTQSLSSACELIPLTIVRRLEGLATVPGGSAR